MKLLVRNLSRSTTEQEIRILFSTHGSVTECNLVLDQETGKLLWNYKMGTRIEESTLCIYRDKVFALAGDGYVHAVE